MVAKQLPQATFRISDNELWESFKAKAKANGTNASAVFWQFAKDYVDGNLGSVDGVAISTPNLDGIDTRIDERIAVALESLRSEYDAKLDEAIALAKKPMLSVLREKVIAA